MIERSNTRGRFTESELRAKVKESREFWNSPAGIQRQAEIEIERRNFKPAPSRFPELAKRGTKPSLVTSHAVPTPARNTWERLFSILH